MVPIKCISGLQFLRSEETMPNSHTMAESSLSARMGVAKMQMIADKQALLSFKSLIYHDPLRVLSSWSSSNSSFPCTDNWVGIACDQQGTRVVSLDLKASNLTGSISPSLSNLTLLRHLNLSINSLHGAIPPQLGLLTSLSHLDLKENSLTGPIPTELGNCSSLIWLDLSHNQLNGALPSSLGQLSNLFILQLHDLPNLSGSIPPQFGNLTNLTYLYLGSNNLTGNIPPELGGLTNLKELYLMLNKLSGIIPAELGELKELQYLALFVNNFEGNIPSHLGNLTNLKYFWCLLCNLEGTIPAELGNLRNLKELDLSLNFKISGDIPSQLGQLQNLQTLKLFQMNLSGSIPREFGNLKSLQHLYAFSNQLTGGIPPELGQLEELQDLQLYFNQLTGALPTELSKLRSLQNLILFTNRLHGNIISELGELTNLSSLYLGDNLFTGYLPSTLGNLSNLQYFEVSPNQLVGPIPTTLGKLKNLIYIDVSKNRLSGGLPVELVNCTKLQWIKMANNSLSGEVPKEYGSFRLLHSLALANNAFSGSLPGGFSNQSSLVVLDLQHNNFSGTLPESWAFLENVRILSVGSNNLEGSLPGWLWSLNHLQLLDLGQNHFSGIISTGISHLDGFKHNDSTASDTNQNLYKDDLVIDTKGTVAYFKYVWGIVVSLDLSGNAFSGVIPNEIGFLSGLYNLNLSHNLLTGLIPDTLGSVRTLESLDLSNNLLDGQIPPQLSELTSLAFLNLSNNRLSGAIPNGNQFNSFSNQSYLGNPGLCGYPLTLDCKENSTQGTITHKRSALRIRIVAGCISVIVAVIIITILSWLIISKRRLQEDCQAQVFDKGITISARELSRATKGYSSSNIIGRGGSSIVYKGTLRNGMVIAVKKFKMVNQSEAQQSFASELTVLGQIRHRNLVKILGAFSTHRSKCFVLEYVPNGSLDAHLYKDKSDLSWRHCFTIALGVAHGLVYLHEETGLGQVLHCDLKPSNILLDEDFEPHISDFGISRLMTSQKDGCNEAPVLRGSIGYVAPEYAYGERITDKVDVYSYGVVLLEMLSRKRPTSDALAEGASLTVWAESAFCANWVDVIDPTLRHEIEEEKTSHEVHEVLALALSCVRDDPRSRPPMKVVLGALFRVKRERPPYMDVDQFLSGAGLAGEGSPLLGNRDSTTSFSSSAQFSTENG